MCSQVKKKINLEGDISSVKYIYMQKLCLIKREDGGFGIRFLSKRREIGFIFI